ncbi:MAG TPA: hypothetical protein DEF51_13720 [Myxococcales bacterium]|nr:hypothetical protein [Myxococcales bacterium]
MLRFFASACAAMWLSACAANTPPPDAQVRDAPDGPRPAPEASPSCAAAFPDPTVEPTEWMSPITHAATGDVMTNGASAEIMLGEGGRRVVPLRTSVNRATFSCWLITVEVLTADGARFETPAHPALSEGEADPLVFHVRVGDLVDERATVTVRIQGNSSEYFEWSRELRLR